MLAHGDIVLSRSAAVLRGNRELLVSSYLGEGAELEAAAELEVAADLGAGG